MKTATKRNTPKVGAVGTLDGIERCEAESVQGARFDYEPPVVERTIVRKCRLCGKDASPNYFYCPPCHHMMN